MCPHTAIYVSSYCYKSSVLMLLVLRHSRDLYRHGRRAEESAACERMSRKEIQAELHAMNQEHKRIKAESILTPDAGDETDTRQLCQTEEHRRLKAEPHSEASGPSLSTLSGLVDSQCSKCHTQCGCVSARYCARMMSVAQISASLVMRSLLCMFVCVSLSRAPSAPPSASLSLSLSL